MISNANLFDVKFKAVSEAFQKTTTAEGKLILSTEIS